MPGVPKATVRLLAARLQGEPCPGVRGASHPLAIPHFPKSSDFFEPDLSQRHPALQPENRVGHPHAEQLLRVQE